MWLNSDSVDRQNIRFLDYVIEVWENPEIIFLTWKQLVLAAIAAQGTMFAGMFIYSQSSVRLKLRPSLDGIIKSTE